MSKNLTKKLENKEWYQALVEECKAIITEAVYTSRWALVEGYWGLGKRIREDKLAQEFTKGNKTFVQDLARNLNIADRTIYYALQAYDKYPDLDQVPEGKNISWNKLITKYLPEPKPEKQIPLPKGKYQVIYADPPWQYNNEGFEQSAEQKYSTMPIKDICEMPVREKTGEMAVLFLWATNAFLKEAISVCESWGFEYKTNMAWIKNKGPTIGWFTKSRHELLLIATKGEGMHPKEKFNSWFEAPVGRHSEKPKLVYDMIEKMYDGPYLELFLRGNPYNKKWQGWGNEVSDQ